MQIKDRIKELRRIPAKELTANPKNWRRHPQWQRDGMQAIFEQVGYAGALIAYESAEGLMLIDGHLRQEMTPDEEVPVLILDVTEAEADILLASYDPLTAMASEDGQALTQLLDTIKADEPKVQALLLDIRERWGSELLEAVENSTDAYHLPNPFVDGQTFVPNDEAGQPYKAFLIHLPQNEYDELMEAVFTLGDRWGEETMAAVVLRLAREAIAQE
jgi:hypothetical protein